jgi:hypothetical protein
VGGLEEGHYKHFNYKKKFISQDKQQRNMNFIKKVFENRIDDFVHLQFQKFSKGEFLKRALIKAKKVGNKTTISTTAEFANDIVAFGAEKLGNEKAEVSGVVVSTADLQGLEYENKKQFMGIKQYVIQKELTGNEILALLNKFQKAFFALSFKGKDFEIKIKAKAPKSAKPSTKGDEAIKPDFCKLVTTDESITKEFIFEKPAFKDAEISHNFIIKELILPQGEKDFAIIRERAKRKGKIVRKAVIDGKEIITEKEFEA